jgi:DNA processing protein
VDDATLATDREHGAPLLAAFPWENHPKSGRRLRESRQPSALLRRHFCMSTTTQLLEPRRFPWGVRDLPKLPDRLYAVGCLPPPPWVAVVGTRAPTREAEEWAGQLAFELGTRGVVVASGGAVGIDAAAHRGALAANARTVVVAPAGYAVAYPAVHRELFDAIVDSGGAYLSRVDAQGEARRHSFFLRNQLLVACAQAVVLVQAPFKSGARNAALWARRLSRPLLVVPQAPWSVEGQGNLLELRLGAAIVSDWRDVMDTLTRCGWPELGPVLGVGPRELARGEAGRDDGLAASAPLQGELWAESPTIAEHAATQGVAPASAALRVADALRAGARHPDEIQRLTGLDVPEIRVHLTELLLTRDERAMQPDASSAARPPAQRRRSRSRRD